ncbi:uncharacterized protein MONOS_823 [Monocercomonoides exilis]|uniref:uncharacterized protein n=1 Tax=Monocercomonoides exilis TaxID=2049356 RepID=UPI00355A447A|nr:hypothetical protein MONOS_823 [Monocercomonoides exilis]|eukprot:MONOS_823.1-p1 / transcript=MONOS_823.1 / gene=MONOS_823 / organism=Monocercomonoides_exilis_PA203 / gene_product=unspecified product / transcript_product=unspecified product / location=Mono_scaffold00013:213597-216028(-) / protein_length=785 / sequence_SO=supercontig / SO=protein_coding / is_pseudo=false
MLILLFAASFVLCEPCTFDPNNIYEWAEIETCLKTLPWKKDLEETKNVIDILLKNMESYAFRDTLLLPPKPFDKLAMDVVQELKDINEKEWDDGYAFHEEISRVIAKMKDPDTFYSFPCSEYFSYVLPFQFVIEIVKNGDAEELQVKAKEAADPEVTKHHIGLNRLDLTDKVITAIALDGEDFKDNEKPEETIARWAEANVRISRSPAARLNYALRVLFSTRTVSDIPRPKGPLKVRYKNGDDDLEGEIQFYGKVSEKMSSLDEKCGAKAKQFKQTTSASLKNGKQNEQTKKVNIAKRSSSMKEINGPEYLPDYEEVETGPDVKGIVVKSWKTVILRFFAFGEGDEKRVKQMFENVMGTLKKADDAGAKRLVVDLRGTKGDGELPIGRVLFHMLFPNAFPLNGETWLPATDENQAVEKSLLNDLEYYTTEVDTLELIKNIFKEEHKKRTVNANINGKSVVRTTEWTPTHALNFDADDVWEMVDEKYRVGEDRDTPFTPQNILVITDGLCSGMAGMFAKQVKEMKLAKVIGIGKSLLNKDIGFDVASVGGYTTFTTDDLEAAREDAEKKNLTDLPAAFAREHTLFSYSARELLSFDHNTPDVSLSWKVVEADAVVAKFQEQSEYDSADGIVATAELTNKFFESCFAWEVLDDRKNCDGEIKKNGGGEHEVWGRPCNAKGAFDNSTCVFSRCENGYFRKAIEQKDNWRKGTQTGKEANDIKYVCEKIPVLKLKEEEKKHPLTDIPATLAIVACVCVLSLIVALVGAVIAVKSKKVEQKYTAINDDA